MKQITIYACKNTRKNSKSNIKDFILHDTLPYNNIKKQYTIYDLYDVADFIQYQKNNGYPYFRIVVFDDNECMQTFYSWCETRIELIINKMYHWFTYFNLCKFNFSLSELYNDSNICFHIKQFYNK